MYGGASIGPWRQCNAVSPAVTATQTGAGTHNGMALTVKVLDGAAITVSGPQYQSSFTPGAVGSDTCRTRRSDGHPAVHRVTGVRGGEP